ncbi:solute carrier family 41 member 1-like isoform X1 [Amblyomma americanum]
MPPEKMEYGSTGRCDDVESELVRAAAAVQCIAASVRAASLPDTGAVRRDGGLTIVPLGRIPSLEKCPAVVLGSGGDTCSDASSSAFDETSALLKSDREEESWCAFLAQVFPSFILAGLGMVAAGLLLDAVQAWPAFVEASELFILVPALLGLKGNLEMTLASRLATQANLGKAESLRDIVGLAVGNMALLQCQSVVVGTLAALYAVVTSVALSNHVTLRAALLVLASSVATASAASLVLGGVMISVVLVARPLRINPDNVAIPIAAALGDLTTLGLLAVISAALFDLAESRWVSLGLVLALFVLLPAWTYVAYRTENTRGVLSYGWLPIVSAMLISSFAGNILDFAVRRYHSMAAFQPLMNGVGGNLAAVQASRLSTLMHQERSISQPEHSSLQASTPISGSALNLAADNAEAHERGSWLLVALVVPGHLIFMTLISLLKNGSVKLSALFVLFYNVAAILQVAVLLLATRRIVRFLWHRGMDPDSTAIPYVTALGDVLGTSFLAAVFALMTPLGVDTEL